MKKDKEIDMVINLQDANILPLDITKRQVRYLINRVNKLKAKEIILAKGKVFFTGCGYIDIGGDSIRWAEKLGKLKDKTITLIARVKDE